MLAFKYALNKLALS